MTTVDLSPASIEAIARRVADLLRAPAEAELSAAVAEVGGPQRAIAILQDAQRCMMPTPNFDAVIERATTLAVERVMERMQYVQPVRRETYTLADLRIVLACDSDSAVYRTLERMRVRAYAPGKYRVRDVANAMANASVRERKAVGYLDEKGRERA